MSLSETKNKNNIIDYVIFFLLFMFSANVINRYYYFLYAAFVGYLAIERKDIKGNSSVTALIVLAFSMIFFDPNYSYGILGLLKPFAFLIAYYLGYNITRDRRANKEQAVINLIIIMALGMLFHVVLNMSINYDQIIRAKLLDYWTREVSSATLQAAMGIFSVALAVAALLSDCNKWHKLLFTASSLIVLYYNLILAGRTLLIILGITFVVAFIHFAVSYKNKKSKKRIFTVCLLILVVFLWMFLTNTFGINDIIMKSNYYDRVYGDNAVVLEEDGRMDNKMRYLRDFLDYPWGGHKIRENNGGRSAHDLYLDIYSEAGIFALIAVIVVVINSIKNLNRILRDKEKPFAFRQIILCIYLVIHIEFFVEPITRGMPWFFAAFCIVDGALKACLDITDEDKALSFEESSVLKR